MQSLRQFTRVYGRCLCCLVAFSFACALLLLTPALQAQILKHYQYRDSLPPQAQPRLDRARQLAAEDPQAAKQILIGLGEEGYGSAWVEFALLEISSPAPDYEAVASAFELGLSAGYPQGATGLGNLYLRGNGLEADLAKAADYFQQAVSSGDINAALPLGDMYRVGLGMDVNPGKALAMYLEASSVDPSAEAKFLSSIHPLSSDEFTIPTAPPDTPAIEFSTFPIREWFSGVNYRTEANALIGALLVYGIGSAADPDLGVQYLSHAARQGSYIAQYQLGLALTRGTGIAKDPVQAKVWLERALQSAPKETKQDRVSATFARLALKHLENTAD